MITVTAKAAEQIHQAATQSEAEGMFLRIAARRGIDGTIQYGMGFDEQSEEDMLVNSEGVTVIVSPDNLSLLSGAETSRGQLTGWLIGELQQSPLQFPAG